MKEKYWKSLCELAKSYNEEAAVQEHWPPNWHRFESSGTCVIVFNGTEQDCDVIIDYLNERPWRDEDGLDSSSDNYNVKHRHVSLGENGKPR